MPWSVFGNVPAAADALHNQYVSAIQKYMSDDRERPPAAERARAGQLQDKYMRDSAFLDDLLTRLFPVGFKDEYLAWTTAPVAKGAGSDATYTKKLPSASTVMSGIKGKDPNDTMARQAGALAQLMKIIGQTVDQRCPRCDASQQQQAFTADETNRMREYQQAMMAVSLQLLTKDRSMESRILVRARRRPELES